MDVYNQNMTTHLLTATLECVKHLSNVYTGLICAK